MRAMIILGYGFWYFMFVITFYRIIDSIIGEVVANIFALIAILAFYGFFFDDK